MMHELPTDPGIRKHFWQLFAASPTQLVGALMANVCAAVGTLAAKKGLDWQSLDVVDQVYGEQLAGYMFYQVMLNPKTGAKYRLKFVYPPDLLQLAQNFKEALPLINKTLTAETASTLPLAMLAVLATVAGKTKGS